MTELEKQEPNITFSTCWYPFKAKFPETTFHGWIKNMLDTVQKYNLVVYTDNESSPVFFSYWNNPRIKIVVKPISTFNNYHRQDFWRKNHEKNVSLRDKVDWRVNMLWAEKVHFVWETMTKNSFSQTDYYGWIDIGYFRCRPVIDVPKEILTQFPNPEKIQTLNPDKILYALVNNNNDYLQQLIHLIRKTPRNIIPPIPHNQISVGGGFFIGHRNKIEWWRNTFDATLNKYINANVLVKDDQIILADCIFSVENQQHFELRRENNPPYDNWFLFSRALL